MKITAYIPKTKKETVIENKMLVPILFKVYRAIFREANGRFISYRKAYELLPKVTGNLTSFLI